MVLEPKTSHPIVHDVLDDELPELLDADSENVPELVADVSCLSGKNAVPDRDDDGDLSDDDEPPPLVDADSDDEDELPDLIELGDEDECNSHRKPKLTATECVSALPTALAEMLGPNLVVLSVFDGNGGLSTTFKEILKGKQLGDTVGDEEVADVSPPTTEPLAVADAPVEDGAPKKSLQRQVDCPKLAEQGLVRGKERPVVYPGAVGVKQADPQEWSTGLFDCCTDMQSCLLGAVCPCVLYGQTRRLATGRSCIAAALAHFFAMVGGASLGGCLLCHWGYAPCAAAPLRSAIRGKYGLAATSPFQLGSEGESQLADCLVHYWCHPCALCQEYREVKLRTEMEKAPTYSVPPVVEEMEKRMKVAPAATYAKEAAGGVYYTLLAGE